MFWAIAVGIAAVALVPGVAFNWMPQGKVTTDVLIAIVVVALASVLLMRRPFQAAVALAVAAAMFRLYPGDEARTQTVRSFFGVHKIYDTPNEKFRVLMNGTTVHGAQQLAGDDGKPIAGRPEPLTYYHATSAIAQVIGAMRARKGAIRVAVVGLGSGSLACYVEPGADASEFCQYDAQEAKPDPVMRRRWWIAAAFSIKPSQTKQDGETPIDA